MTWASVYDGKHGIINKDGTQIIFDVNWLDEKVVIKCNAPCYKCCYINKCNLKRKIKQESINIKRFKK